MTHEGQVFGGTYRIIRQIGQGGMGKVYAAEKITTHEIFALKFMHRELITDETSISRFKREFEALTAIRHPNVVNVFDWYLSAPDEDDQPYIVMELLEGEGLDALLRRESKLEIRDTIAIMLQTLDGLAAAHKVGVVHRDLGPPNVYLVDQHDRKFHVKLLDFGMAKPLGRGEHHLNLTKEGMLMGKPAYVAPEIFHGQPLDERSDVFGCGMMMIRMLTGRLPYGTSNSELLWTERYTDRKSDREYPSIKTMEPSLPDSMCEVVSRASMRRPGERYKNASEMQAAILEVELELRVGGGEGADRSSYPEKPGKTSETGRVDKPVEGSAPDQVEVRDDSKAPTETVSKLFILEETAPRRDRALVTAAVALSALLLLAGIAGGLYWSGLFKKKGPEVNPPTPSMNPESGEPSKTAQPDAAVALDTVHIVILGVPQGASVRIDDEVITGNPPEGMLPAGSKSVKLTIAAQGYETYVQDVVPDRDLVISAKMEKATSTSGKTGAPRPPTALKKPAGKKTAGEKKGDKKQDLIKSLVESYPE